MVPLYNPSPLSHRLAAASSPVQWLEGLWKMTMSPASSACLLLFRQASCMAPGQYLCSSVFANTPQCRGCCLFQVRHLLLRHQCGFECAVDFFAVCTSAYAASVLKPCGTVDADHVLSVEKTFSNSSSTFIDVRHTLPRFVVPN